jgi:hypothetical protein
MKYDIRNRADLQAAISLLEDEVEAQKELLNDHFHELYESYRPVSVVRGIMNEVVTSEDFRSNLLTATIGISTGYMAKKLFVRGKSSLLKRLAGNFFQYGVANLLINPSRILKSVIMPVLEFISPGGQKNAGGNEPA